MQRFDTAPQLACHVGKIPLPAAVASDSDEICALTGTPIPRGTENLVPWTAPNSFRDQYDIVDRRSAFVSQETAAILQRPFMQRYSKSVICPDGWFPFASTNDVAWFLRHPPNPPFVVIFGLAKMEHLLWRTPLSLSRELFFVRLGHRVLRIRHSRLMQVFEQIQPATEAINAYAKTVDRAPVKCPFLALSRELNADSTGQLYQVVYDAMDAGVPEAAAFHRNFSSLTSGELWALGRLYAARSLELTQPQPITITE